MFTLVRTYLVTFWRIVGSIPTSNIIAKIEAIDVRSAICETDLNSEINNGKRQTITIVVVFNIVLAVLELILVTIVSFA